MLKTVRTAFVGAIMVVAAGLGAPAAQAATVPQVAGSYALNYEWYSAPGYWQTTNLTLNADGTCSLVAGCTWTLAGASSTDFTMSVPNPRRQGIIYRGAVTSSGLSSPSSYGHQYFGNPYFKNAAESDWYANRK